MTAEFRYKCPACEADMQEFALRSGSSSWACGSCGGVLLNTAALRATSPKQYASLWRAFQTASYGSPRPCPSCGCGFRTFAGPDADNPVQLEACRGCLVLWFDSGELEKLGIAAPKYSADMSRALADLELAFDREEAELKETTRALWAFAYDLRRILFRGWRP